MIDNTDSIQILVADDDPDIRQLVVTVLEVQGYSVTTVEDGDEAVNSLSESLPDLAILDLNMPGRSGQQVCEFIRKQEDGALVPVIILTACDDIQTKLGAFEFGVDDYLIKPFVFQELLARVKAFLRIRELNLILKHKNEELKQMQQKLVEQERQSAVNQLAGAAAHELNQPLSAMLLNCRLLESLPPESDKYPGVLEAVIGDVKRLSDLINQLKTADANKKTDYYGDLDILEIKK